MISSDKQLLKEISSKKIIETVTTLRSKMTPINSLNIDNNREEEIWNDEIELLLQTWKQDIYDSHAKYEAAGYHFRSQRRIISLPSIIIPATLAPITAAFTHWDYIVYVNALGFSITSCLNAMSHFFNYADKEQGCFDYAGKYGSLYNDIELELTKKRKFRIQMDVFISTVMLKYDSLNTHAPVLPQFIHDKDLTSVKTSKLLKNDF